MKPRLRAVAAVFLAMLLCAAWYGNCFAGGNGAEKIGREAEECLSRHSLYAGSIDMQSLRNAWTARGADGMRSFLRQFDKYSSYTTAEELAFLKGMRERLPAGVGMDIFHDRQDRIRCVPYPDSPAEKAGIAYGDILKGVDGVALRGRTLPEIAAEIRGTDGSVVMFSLHGEGQPMRTLLVQRKRAEYPTVVRTGDAPAVFRIFRFSPRTARELRSVLRTLKKAQGCIIDLRGNTGGNMEAGMECARLFLKKGDIVLHVREGGGTRLIRAEKNGAWSDIPVAVVQDRFTASASELFIASLTAAGRARSRGTQSAGKACVQNLFTLSDGSVLKLTTEKMLYPLSEEDWEGIGIPTIPSSELATE